METKRKKKREQLLEVGVLSRHLPNISSSRTPKVLSIEHDIKIKAIIPHRTKSTHQTGVTFHIYLACIIVCHMPANYFFPV